MASGGDPSSKPNHLEPSELGTKEYWDRLYTTELTNHSHDPADRGTVWFDDSDAEDKLLEFLGHQAGDPCSSSSSPSDYYSTTTTTTTTTITPLDRRCTSFLDLGCGNGSLLFALRQGGWEGRFLGVDYSEKSVALARQIAASEENAQGGKVEFEAWDVLQGSYDTVLAGKESEGWDVVLDKGTFDAISLSDDKDTRGRRICEGYKERIIGLVKQGGLFLVTSCNWTEAELETWFGEGSAEVQNGIFVRVGRVKYPSFSFGGVKGQTISTLCFQKR